MCRVYFMIGSNKWIGIRGTDEPGTHGIENSGLAHLYHRRIRCYLRLLFINAERFFGGEAVLGHQVIALSQNEVDFNGWRRV